MKIDAKRTETHETRWTGTLTGTQILDMVRDALRKHVGAPHSGTKLDFHVMVSDKAQFFPDVVFELVHDHDWVINNPMPVDADA